MLEEEIKYQLNIRIMNFIIYIMKIMIIQNIIIIIIILMIMIKKIIMQGRGNIQEKNMLYMNSSEKDNFLNENILKKKSSEKEIEQSLTPLNMDWVKVMNLIYSSNDIDATTLAFNAAMSAVEKKRMFINNVRFNWDNEK